MVKNKVVAIDFDGTITEQSPFPLMGNLRPNCKKAIEFIRSQNLVVIWTARTGTYLQEAILYLKSQGIAYDAINIDIKGGSQRKIEADVYIDDRSFPRAEINWFEIEEWFKNTEL